MSGVEVSGEMYTTLLIHHTELKKICQIYGVKSLELFGSAARVDFNSQTSDLDFLVDFEPNHPMGAFDRYFGLKFALEDLLGYKVDLVEAKAIKNPYFRQSIEQDKMLIYET